MEIDIIKEKELPIKLKNYLIDEVKKRLEDKNVKFVDIYLKNENILIINRVEIIKRLFSYLKESFNYTELWISIHEDLNLEKYGFNNYELVLSIKEKDNKKELKLPPGYYIKIRDFPYFEGPLGLSSNFNTIEETIDEAHKQYNKYKNLIELNWKSEIESNNKKFWFRLEQMSKGIIETINRIDINQLEKLSEKYPDYSEIIKYFIEGIKEIKK